MRKVVFQMLTSLDGFFEGPGGDIGWHNVDAEFNKYAIDLLDNADMLLFGRKTYELMAGFWPTPAAIRDDPDIAKRMNGMQKIVFSQTLQKAGWNNTRLVRENIKEEILKLKHRPGEKYLLILASSDLSLFFIDNNLIDEFQIIINPVVLGAGKTIFNGIQERLKLRLLDVKRYSSGNVVLYYSPEEMGEKNGSQRNRHHEDV